MAILNYEEVSPIEFLDACNSDEINEISYLLRDGSYSVNINQRFACKDEFFVKSVRKLLSNRHQLTKKDEDKIMEICKKIV